MAADIAQTIPLAFGSTSVAKVTAAGVTPEGYSICTSAGATVEMDNEMRNIAGLTWTMEAKTREHAVIIGTTGRITLSPAHAPTTLTVVTDQGIDVRDHGEGYLPSDSVHLLLPDVRRYKFEHTTYIIQISNVSLHISPTRHSPY